jgi:transcriptional regulator with XRE-family HTH domain
MTLAEMLALELERTGRSCRSVALEIGLSPQTLNNLVKGRRPDFETLCRVGRFIHEPLGLLMVAAGLTPAIDLEAERAADSLLGDDWCTVQLVRLMRRMSHEHRKRLVQLVELFVEPEGGALDG